MAKHRKKNNGIVKILLAVVLLAAIAFGATYGIRFFQVNSAVESLVEACNDKDINQLLDSINPTVAAPFKAITSLVMPDEEEQIDSIFDVIADGLDLDGEKMDGIRVSIKKVSVDEDDDNHAKAYGTGEIDVGDKTIERYVTFDMGCKDGDWYVNYFTTSKDKPW